MIQPFSSRIMGKVTTPTCIYFSNDEPTMYSSWLEGPATCTWQEYGIAIYIGKLLDGTRATIDMLLNDDANMVTYRINGGHEVSEMLCPQPIDAYVKNVPSVTSIYDPVTKKNIGDFGKDGEYISEMLGAPGGKPLYVINETKAVYAVGSIYPFGSAVFEVFPDMDPKIIMIDGHSYELVYSSLTQGDASFLGSVYNKISPDAISFSETGFSVYVEGYGVAKYEINSGEAVPVLNGTYKTNKGESIKFFITGDDDSKKINYCVDEGSITSPQPLVDTPKEEYIAQVAHHCAFAKGKPMPYGCFDFDACFSSELCGAPGGPPLFILSGTKAVYAVGSIYRGTTVFEVQPATKPKTILIGSSEFILRWMC